LTTKIYFLKSSNSWFRIFSLFTYTASQAYSITLHIPVGKARSTRFGFHIFQILLQRGTGHSLPPHFHTLFSDKEKEKHYKTKGSRKG
jgi:hypothetical protein